MAIIYIVLDHFWWAAFEAQMVFLRCN